jgi:hypothetical protein
VLMRQPIRTIQVDILYHLTLDSLQITRYLDRTSYSSHNKILANDDLT